MEWVMFGLYKSIQAELGRGSQLLDGRSSKLGE
jgi:hypothetical protein